jgi:pimeloyl-ACP methyl ester carboxylesterase
MPFTANKGIRIHYEVAGQGAPLVLQHSLGRSLDAWWDFGYAQVLSQDYQLILIDARGHGASDKPHDAGAYQMERMVGDVVAVLDALGISRAHYYGYSMGTMIGFHITSYAFNRFQSLILGGGNPYGFRADAEQQFLEQLISTLQMGVEQGMEAVVAFLEQTGGPMPPVAKARVLTNDPHAILAVTKAIEEMPSVEDMLPMMTLPTLVYAGEADPFYAGASACVANMPSATFISLPDLGHTPVLYRSDLILPNVRSFLSTHNQLL